MMISLTSSNISQLMNYVGFATWFSIGAAVSLSFFNKSLTNGRIQTYLECNNPNDLNLTNQWYDPAKVLCVPWLRWKCPDLERPIRVRIGFSGNNLSGFLPNLTSLPFVNTITYLNIFLLQKSSSFSENDFPTPLPQVPIALPIIYIVMTLGITM